jgi:hypothetical protein
MSITVTRTGTKVTINLGEEHNFPVLERYSDLVDQDLTATSDSSIVLEATKEKLIKVSPVKPTLRSVFSVLNSNKHYNDSVRTEIVTNLLDALKEVGMHLSDFAKLLVPEELIFYAYYPLIREPDSLVLVTESLSRYLDGNLEFKSHEGHGDQLSFKELVSIYSGGRSGSKLLSAAGKRLIKEQKFREIIFDDPKMHAEFRQVFDENADNRILIEDTKRDIDGNGKELNVVLLYNYQSLNQRVFREIKALNEIFSLDYAVKLLENEDKSYDFETHTIEFLKQFGEKTRYEMALEQGFNLTDASNQWYKYRNADSIPDTLRSEFPEGITIPRSWKDLKELHDKISRDYLRIKAEADRLPINYSDEEKSVMQMSVADMEIKLATDTSDLVIWGGTMKNCIASYSDKAVQKSSYLLGVYRNDTLLYNMELTRSNSGKSLRIVQLTAFRNASVPQEDRTLIEEAVSTMRLTS